ncbi:CBS domain-containing protein [Dokdonella sp. MW10]|uniref:CBS domain-containing protein n=1 Tax=Dokdonella sp. MW10 TaxID=2992926 RepID=UPI003F80FB45
MTPKVDVDAPRVWFSVTRVFEASRLVTAATHQLVASSTSNAVAHQSTLSSPVTTSNVVIREVADGKTDGSVDRFMSADVKFCYDDEDAESVARTMASLEVRRLPVLDRKERLIGMVSLANLTQTRDGEAKREFLESIATPH